jgi:predicted  nucleic acid-binding Zn-ribbon protein
VLENLREKNAQLEEKLTKTESARAALEQELQSVEVQGTIDAQQTVVDVATREERAQLAQERAEFSRMRAELTKKLAEIEHEVERTERSPNEVDEKMQVLRSHLREIHGNDKRERGIPGVPGVPGGDGKRGLMSRISGLWKSLDG